MVGERDSREKGLEQSEGSMGPVKPMAKQSRRWCAGTKQQESLALKSKIQREKDLAVRKETQPEKWKAMTQHSW